MFVSCNRWYQLSEYSPGSMEQRFVPFSTPSYWPRHCFSAIDVFQNTVPMVGLYYEGKTFVAQLMMESKPPWKLHNMLHRIVKYRRLNEAVILFTQSDYISHWYFQALILCIMSRNIHFIWFFFSCNIRTHKWKVPFICNCVSRNGIIATAASTPRGKDEFFIVLPGINRYPGSQCWVWYIMLQNR